MPALRVVTITVLIWCSCLPGIPTASAQSTEAEHIHMACLMARDAAQRIEACTAAINSKNLKPTLRADAFVARASISLQQGRFDQARADLVAARELGTDRSQLIEGALAKLDELQAAATRPEVQQRITFFRCQTEADLALRLKACDSIVAASLGDPAKEAAAHALRAAAEVALDDFDGAERDIDGAMKLDPSTSFYSELKARVQFFKGDYSEALTAYRRLEYISSDSHRFPTIAALEYIAGDRERSIGLYRSAHQAGPPGNVFLFYAAIVRSDLSHGEVAPFRELDFGAAEGPFAGALLAYRLGRIGASELLAAAQDVPLQRGQALCMAQFNIGHRRVLERSPEDAKPPFVSATELCSKTTFEYHAARKWLSQLAP